MTDAKALIPHVPQAPFACPVRIRRRPMLLTGAVFTLTEETVNPVELAIDEEQDLPEQTVALWHEVVHLLKAAAGQPYPHDEARVEALARKLAAAAPGILGELGIGAPERTPPEGPGFVSAPILAARQKPAYAGDGFVLLADLPPAHPLRNSPVADIHAQYRHVSDRAKGEKGWHDVKPTFHIAKAVYNALGPAWTDFDDWRAPLP